MKVFVGYDPDQPVSYHVLVQSLLERSHAPVSITPLVLSQLPLTRARELDQTSEFSFTRFLVPWLCAYKGTALYMDPDFLMRCDVAEIFAQIDPYADVTVVKHDYQPKGVLKFLDKAQTSYMRKNWSSLMLYNCDRCTALTPELVNRADAAWLRQLHWASSIGELPRTYNHLVGEYGLRADAKAVHFTQGAPCFEGYANSEFADEWRDTLRAANYHRPRGS